MHQLTVDDGSANRQNRLSNLHLNRGFDRLGGTDIHWPRMVTSNFALAIVSLATNT